MYSVYDITHKGSVFPHVTCEDPKYETYHDTVTGYHVSGETPTYPTASQVLHAVRKDAALDYPLTPIGLDLKANGYVPGDDLGTPCLKAAAADLETFVSQQKQAGLPSERLGYSRYDDITFYLLYQPRVADFCDNSTYSKDPTIDGKVDVTIRPWGSEVSYDELERSFFNLDDPRAWFLNEGCIIERTSHFFYKACCVPRSCVADAIAYDKRYRTVVIGTNSCISKTMTPLMFAEEAIPWIWTMMERLCLRIVYGCRNDNNPKFTEARADVHRMAVMTLRMLTTDLGSGPMNTVSRDHPQYRKLHKKKDPAMMLYVELREHIAHDIKVASNDISRTYEKLYKLYPKTDERSPDFKKHKIKVNALTKKNESSMPDLFKGTKEVITITPELRAHVTKKVREDEAAAEAEEAAAKAAAAENDCEASTSQTEVSTEVSTSQTEVSTEVSTEASTSQTEVSTEVSTSQTEAETETEAES